jgi:hypothetical protein
MYLAAPYTNPHCAAGAYDAWLTEGRGGGGEYLESLDSRKWHFQSLQYLLIMILKMLWNFILGKCTSSLPEILSSGTQIGNKNYESYRSNYENYNILIPQAVLKKKKVGKSRKSKTARKPSLCELSKVVNWVWSLWTNVSQICLYILRTCHVQYFVRHRQLNF